MALIIGSLGLIVGLMAIWLATNAMKNASVQGDLLLQRIRKEQKEALTEVGVKIKALETTTRQLKEQLSSNPEED